MKTINFNRYFEDKKMEIYHKTKDSQFVDTRTPTIKGTTVIMY